MAIRGSCHCGGTVFEVDSAPETVTSCTCSICSKRGALWGYYPKARVRILRNDTPATYRWRTKTVAHNFCAVCGCTTFTESPDFSTGEANLDNPMVNINARLLDDFDLSAVPVVTVDGKNLW